MYAQEKFPITTAASLIQTGRCVGLDFLKLTILAFHEKSAATQTKEMYHVLSHDFFFIVSKYLRGKKRDISSYEKMDI